jgi:hydrogenase expression/formation protein HypC
MCLALPMRIIAVEGSLATIAAEGLEQRASLTLVPQAKVGDYVLVHAGFAINVLSQAEADETLALLAELGEFAASEESPLPGAAGASGGAQGGDTGEGGGAEARGDAHGDAHERH